MEVIMWVFLHVLLTILLGIGGVVSLFWGMLVHTNASTDINPATQTFYLDNAEVARKKSRPFFICTTVCAIGFCVSVYFFF